VCCVDDHDNQLGMFWYVARYWITPVMCQLDWDLEEAHLYQLLPHGKIEIHTIFHVLVGVDEEILR